VGVGCRHRRNQGRELMGEPKVVETTVYRDEENEENRVGTQTKGCRD